MVTGEDAHPDDDPTPYGMQEDDAQRAEGEYHKPSELTQEADTEDASIAVDRVHWEERGIRERTGSDPPRTLRESARGVGPFWHASRRTQSLKCPRLLEAARTTMASSLSAQVQGMAVVLAVLAPFAGMVGFGTAARVSTEGIPAFGHVFVIMGENTELTDLTPATAPYLVGTIKPESAWLTNYYAVTHHSLANYVAMTSGQYTSCERADGEPAQCHQDVDNLFSQLDAAGRSWKVWMESMPMACAVTDVVNGTVSSRYDTAHNPAVYYDSIEGLSGTWSAASPSAECLANDTPTGTAPGGVDLLDAALANGSVGDFNLIVPDKCDDGHTSCPPTSNRILQFDSFLSREVPKVLASPAFGSDGILIITYDEGTSGHFNFHDRLGRGGRVGFAVLGAGVRPGVYGGTFDHYGFLRTMEDGFRLAAYLGYAARARAITSIW